MEQNKEKIEFIKFRERLDFAMKLLEEKFGNAPMHESVEIAKCLFVRSEIGYGIGKVYKY